VAEVSGPFRAKSQLRPELRAVVNKLFVRNGQVTGFGESYWKLMAPGASFFRSLKGDPITGFLVRQKH
jgi:hypothetical protein